MSEVIEKIVSSATEIAIKDECTCSWCKEEIEGVAYVEDFFYKTFKWVYCSRDCIRAQLEYPLTEKAIWDAYDAQETKSKYRARKRALSELSTDELQKEYIKIVGQKAAASESKDEEPLSIDSDEYIIQEILSGRNLSNKLKSG